MLIVSFPRLVLWPALDWAVAVLDTIRVAVTLALRAPRLHPLRADED